MQNNRSAFSNAKAHEHTRIQAFHSPESDKRNMQRSKVAPVPAYSTPSAGSAEGSSTTCVAVTVGVVETERGGRSLHWPGVHFLRSDGCVEKMWPGGQRPKQIVFQPPHGTSYIGAFATPTQHSSYLVRSDGVVDRAECNPGPKQQESMEPPEGVRYVAAAFGHGTLYFTRADGLVDWIKGSGAFQGTIRASQMEKYVSVSAGPSTCYLTRSDGAIDWSKGNGEIKGTIRPREAGVNYIQACAGAHVSYLTRSDGHIDCTQDRGQIKGTIKPPADLKYIEAVAGPHTNFFIRSDGVVDYPIGNGEIKGSIKAPAGMTYTAVSTSESHSYLTRSDGIVDLVDWPSDGAVAQIRVGMPAEPVEGCCIVM